MPVLRHLDLTLNIDHVLRGQGADPDTMRSRRPALVAVAERALKEGLPLITPVAAYHQYSVEGLQHDRLALQGGGYLSGLLISQHLRAAQQVVVVVCTIGADLEQRVTEMMPEDPMLGLGLDGLGSAAVEAAAVAASNHFEALAEAESMQTSLPLSPGMVGWSVEEGQHQIFSLIDAREAGVTLTSTGMMIPRKSISMVLGLGPDLAATGSSCDFCNLRETCRYQDHYP